jgi:hypothetical protein
MINLPQMVDGGPASRPQTVGSASSRPSGGIDDLLSRARTNSSALLERLQKKDEMLSQLNGYLTMDSPSSAGRPQTTMSQSLTRQLEGVGRAKLAEMDSMQGKLRGYQARIHDLSASNDSLRTQAAQGADAQKRNAALEAQIEQLKLEIFHLAAKVQAADQSSAHNNQVHLDLALTNATMESLRKEKGALEDKNGRLESKNSKIEAKVEEMQALLAAERTKNAVLEERTRARQATLDSALAEAKEQNRRQSKQHSAELGRMQQLLDRASPIAFAAAGFVHQFYSLLDVPPEEQTGTINRNPRLTSNAFVEELRQTATGLNPHHAAGGAGGDANAEADLSVNAGTGAGSWYQESGGEVRDKVESGDLMEGEGGVREREGAGGEQEGQGAGGEQRWGQQWEQDTEGGQHGEDWGQQWKQDTEGEQHGEDWGQQWKQDTEGEQHGEDTVRVCYEVASAIKEKAQQPAVQQQQQQQHHHHQQQQQIGRERHEVPPQQQQQCQRQDVDDEWAELELLAKQEQDERQQVELLAKQEQDERQQVPAQKQMGEIAYTQKVKIEAGVSVSASQQPPASARSPARPPAPAQPLAPAKTSGSAPTLAKVPASAPDKVTAKVISPIQAAQAKMSAQIQRASTTQSQRREGQPRREKQDRERQNRGKIEASAPAKVTAPDSPSRRQRQRSPPAIAESKSAPDALAIQREAKREAKRQRALKLKDQQSQPPSRRNGKAAAETKSKSKHASSQRLRSARQGARGPGSR